LGECNGKAQLVSLEIFRSSVIFMVSSATVFDPISVEIPCLVISPRIEMRIPLDLPLFSAKGGRHQARDCREACQILRQNAIAVVLAETDLPDGGWRDLLILLSSDPSHPKLVVLLGAGQEEYRTRLKSLGAFDALPVNSSPALVASTVTAAYIAWLKETWISLAVRQSSCAAMAAGAGVAMVQ
jgi:hypothetical protein